MTITKSKYQNNKGSHGVVSMMSTYTIDLFFGAMQALCTIDIYIYTCRHHKIIN